jgi:hypothetical protein
MLVNDQRLGEVITQVNKVLQQLDKRLKELEDAKEKGTSQRQSTSKNNVVRKKS